MRLNRLVVLFAMEAVATETTTEGIQGKAFLVNNFGATTTTTTATTVAQNVNNVSDKSPDQINCELMNYKWVESTGGFGYCYQEPVRLPDNQQECEAQKYFWHVRGSYGICTTIPPTPEQVCRDLGGKWVVFFDDAGMNYCDTTCLNCYGTCSSNMVCVCSVGQTGANCEVCLTGYHRGPNYSCILTSVPDACLPLNFCSNHGRCIKSADHSTATCECNVGFTGTSCQTSLASPCNNAGDCNGNGRCELHVTSSYSYQTCKCFPGFIGVTCETPIVGPITIDPCEALNFCSNRGTCYKSADLSTATCQCNAGFTGASCDGSLATPCSTVNYCNGNGNCAVHVASSYSYQLCTCFPGFTGVTCDTPSVGPITIDPCEALNFCSNRGTCYKSADLSTANCQCNVGFTGESCQTDANSPCTAVNNCNGNGSCQVHATGTTTYASCNCFTGFTGVSCEGVVNPILTCADLKYCNGHGDCFEDPTGGTCVCDSQHTGTDCSTNKPITMCADLKYCNGHGECFEDRTGGRCVCDSTHTGIDCSTKVYSRPCTVNVCLNDGVCKETDDRSWCECPTGFNGEKCQFPPGTPECTFTECNHGTCKEDNAGDASCTCEDGWEGVSCNTEIPCIQKCNSGTCTHRGNAQFCECPQDTYGDNCEFDCRNCAIGEVCEKETSSTGKVISAVCAVKKVSLCDNIPSICDNGCTCNDPMKDGFFFQCVNAPGQSFLGRRCQWAGPTVTCTPDEIKITVPNSFHSGFAGQKSLSTGLGVMTPVSSSDATIISFPKSDFGKISNPRMVDGSLLVGSEVKLVTDHPVFSHLSTPVFSFECRFRVKDSTSATFTPPQTPPQTSTITHAGQNYKVELDFYGADASFAANRKPRQQAMMTVGEDIFVNLDPQKSNPAMTSGVQFVQCRLDRVVNHVAADSTIIIDNGCPVPVSGTYVASFATPQPVTGVEFKFTVPNFTKEGTMHLRCTAKFCDNCPAFINCPNNAGRRRRDISESDTFSLDSGPLFIVFTEELESEVVHIS